MAWIQLRLDTRPEEIEVLEGWLLACGASAVTLEDNRDQPLLEPGVGETPLWNHIQLTGLFPAEQDIEGVLNQLSSDQRATLNPRVEILEDRDWIREWMSQYQPMAFGRLWVCPSWTEPPAPDAPVLFLDPGLAFGTGTHPTTALCLEQLASIDLENARVMDYGCGSGVLAIAALKLGAAYSCGVDIDPQAIAATGENAIRNRIAATRLSVSIPDKLEDDCRQSFDVVVANILAGPLQALSDTLIDLLAPGGQLLLAGMLDTQADSLAAHYRSRIELKQLSSREEWVCLGGKLDN